MEKISKTIKNPFVLAIALNLVFLLAYLILGSCRFASMDDFFMSSILSGAYGGEYDVHLYFVNAIYGILLKPFYSLFPGVGWYYVFEIAEVFVAFTVVVYVLLTRLGFRFGGILSLLFLSCLSPTFYYQSDFTRNAALLTATSILMLCLGDSTKKKYLLWGIVLAIAGFVMRKEAFYLGVPCLSLLLLYRWVNTDSVCKIPWANLVAILACCLLAFAASKFDKSLYQNSEYKYYAAYQGPRAVFGDGMYYDYDATMDEIEERNLHGLDFEMLTNWVYYDTQILAKDSLSKYIDVVNRNRHDIVLSKMPIAVIRELSQSLHDVGTWVWVLFSLLLLNASRRSLRVVPWFSLGYVILAYTYLLYLNRVVPHVESSIWVYATVSMIPFLEKDGLQKIQLSKGMQGMMIAAFLMMYAFGFYGAPEHTKAKIFHAEDDKRWNALMQFEKDNPDKIFFFDFTAYKRFVRRLGGGYESLPPGRLDRIIPLGYWNVHLPGMKRSLEKMGIENPMRSITRSDALVVQYLNPDKFEDFLDIHYDVNVSYRTLHWAKTPGKEFISFDMIKFYESGVNVE